MTRHLFLVLAAITLTTEAFAQQGLALGGNIGANATFLIDNKRYGDVDYTAKTTLRPSFGIAVTNLFTDNWGIAAEYNFAWLGQKYMMQDASKADRNGSILLRYHQIPVMVAFSGGDYRTRFMAMFGPQFSFLQYATHYNDSNNATERITPSFKRWDVGLLAFGGGNITVVDNFYISTGLRLYYGLNTINTDPNLIPESTVREADYLQNAYIGWSAGLHYIFRDEKTPRE
jgi:hypothetical protein